MTGNKISDSEFDELTKLELEIRELKELHLTSEAEKSREKYLQSKQRAQAIVADEKLFEAHLDAARKRARLTKSVEQLESDSKTLNAGVRELKAELTQLTGRIGDLSAKLSRLDSPSGDIEKLKSQVAALEKNSAPMPRTWLYPTIFGVVILFVGALVAFGWAQKPTVAINYNVGDIISGLLVGVGAIIASIAYARTRGEVR